MQNGDQDERKFLLYAKFSEAYSFRILTEILRPTTAGHLEFSKKAIRYLRANDRNTVLFSVDIKTCELPEYHLNLPDEDAALQVGVPLNDLRTITRPIQKKHSMVLCMYDGDTDIYIQPLDSRSNGTGQSVNTLRSRNIDEVVYSIPEYERNEETPNVTIPAADFSKMCSGMGTIKCEAVAIRGYSSGMVCEGIIQTGVTQRTDTFGTVQKASKPEIETKVAISTIKTLSKLNNMCPNGTLKLFFQEDRPVKIVCNIGVYGRLTIFLKDVDEE